jgi:hypothetical protein
MFENNQKNPILRVGTTLVKQPLMKVRFTYKEFSILVGILVAIVLIVLTLWIGPLSEESGEVSLKLMPQVTPAAVKVATGKVIQVIQSVL